jgi:pimeloyl-ACP methyl ester carboxylesterase
MSIPRYQPPAEAPSRKSRRAPVLARIGLGSLSYLAPPLAARWAERLFLTPGRRPLPEDERLALATGHRFEPTIASHRIAAWSWGEGPPVYLVHGWGGYAGQLIRFIPGLVSAGHSVVAFDAPGHGASDGRTSSLVQIAETLGELVERNSGADLAQGVVSVIGHSIGGAATAFAMHRGLRVRRAVFIGSPADLITASHRFGAAAGLSAGVIARMRRRIERRFGVSWDEIQVQRIAPRMTADLLVVHDESDPEVPFDEALTIASAWPGARLERTSGLGHRRILRDPGVTALAAGFIRDPQAVRAGSAPARPAPDLVKTPLT